MILCEPMYLCGKKIFEPKGTLFFGVRLYSYRFMFKRKECKVHHVK
jgi:hypothetical protein